MEEIPLKPIQRAEPLSEQVYRYVREAILSGKLAAGEKIVETKLASELQVSRSPVREAMQLLHNEQLVVEQDGAMCVFQPTANDLYDLYDLRLAVEPAATRKAAEVVRQSEGKDVLWGNPGTKDNTSDVSPATQLSLLEQNLHKMKRCLEIHDMNGVLRLNSEFHQVIWGLSGNMRFVRILETVSDLILYYCLLILNINNQQTNILEEHASIYKFIKEGDGDRAYAAMYNHIMKDLDVIGRQARFL